MKIGCSEHKFGESGEVVDECICDTELCNKEMGPIPETTTTSPTTTTEGARCFSISLLHRAYKVRIVFQN